jgi:hypothetical protein
MANLTKQADFPKFLHGSVPALQRRVKTEAKRWAESYVRDRTFPIPDTIAVPAGTVVCASSVTDFARETPAWRLYFTRLLNGAISEVLNWQDYERVSVDFEGFVCAFPWGALSAGIEHMVPNSAQRVSARIEAILSFWEVLSAMRYVDKGLQPVTLPELMQNHFSGLMEMWLPETSGDSEKDLRRAIDVLRRATPVEIRERVVARIEQLAHVDQRIKNSHRFSDRAWLADEIAKTATSAYENLATGYVPDLLRALYIIDDSIRIP